MRFWIDKGIKKILAILLVAILLLGLVGCVATTNREEPSTGIGTEINITRVHSDYFDAEIIEEIGTGTYIIRDKNTDVLYLVVGGYYSAVVTPIYNTDGTLKLYGQEK